MMQLLIPLGLLGLLGILMLIIIYIIKPNYQTKHVSTTFVWRLSLKYKKKRLPTSRIRNIILFLCQVLILTAMAGILAKPAIVYSNETGEYDTVAIIDSSASMYAGNGKDTRFERAIDMAMELSDETILRGGYSSVILADAAPTFLGRRVSAKDQSILDEEFDALLAGDRVCSYGSSDMDAALSLAEEVLAENPSAEVYIYTDTQYLYTPENVSVVSVCEQGEWNAAVLSAETELIDGYYSVSVEVACYGRDMDLEVRLDISGADAATSDEGGRFISVSKMVSCDGDSVQKIVFCNGGGADDENVVYYDLGEKDKFYTYQSLHVSLSEEDSFDKDNDFYLYDGQKELVKVLYASSDPNPFMTSVLDTMKVLFQEQWDLQVDEVPKGQEAPESGYDFYIFEHVMPRILPTDGACLLFDPDIAPIGSRFRIRSVSDNQKQLVPCDEIVAHPVTEYLTPANIQVSRLTILDYEEDYTALLSVNSYPLLLVQNEGPSKIAVMPFSLHYSNLAYQIEWPILIYNLFRFFLPSTVDKTAFEVNEEIVLNDRGPSVSYSDEEDPITEFPATLRFAEPGTYTFMQQLYFDAKNPVPVNVFVKIPRNESNIWVTEDMLEDLYRGDIAGSSYDDLLVYVAAALVALLFLEWWLQSRDGR